MDTITITVDEYNKLKRESELYQKMVADNSKAGKASAAKLTPEQRKARAKKAVEARIKKYRQGTRQTN